MREYARISPKSEIGFVYVMANDAMPGILKIRRTVHAPEKRAQELSIGTGVPAKFRVLFYATSQGCAQLESELHTLLATARVSRNREFFRCPMELIASAMINYPGEEVALSRPDCRETDHALVNRFGRPTMAMPDPWAMANEDDIVETFAWAWGISVSAERFAARLAVQEVSA